METGILARAEIWKIGKKPLLDYLSLVEGQQHPNKLLAIRQDLNKSPSTSFSESRLQVLLNDVLSFLENQINSVLQMHTADVLSGHDKVGIDVIRSSTTLGIVTLALLSSPASRQSSRNDRIRDTVAMLGENIRKLLEDQVDSEEKISGMIQAFGNLLSLKHVGSSAQGAREMARFFNPQFWKNLKTQVEKDASNDDFMAIDDGFESQNSRSKSDTQDTSFSRQAELSLVDTQTYRAVQKLRICLPSFIKPSENDHANLHIDEAFFEYLTQLPAEEVLACRTVFDEIFSSKTAITENAAILLLEFVGQELLQPDAFERSEEVHCLSLGILAGLAEVWAYAEGDLDSVASELYEWYVKEASPKRILSPASQVCLGAMLKRVLELRPDYARRLDIVSAQSSLFRILEEGSSFVRFSIGRNLASIFKFFVLKEHESILDDILSSLPLEPQCIEATAVRLHIISSLGSSYSTLLRRCLYAIVEAPALVPRCLKYAQMCFSRMSMKLHINRPAELFKLFSPQIIYTWLNERMLNLLPFQAFGYNGIQNLYQDTLVEITAQIVMRGKDLEWEQLAALSEKSQDQLLTKSFGRAAAYCIARDASVHPDVDPPAANGVARLRKLVGKDTFTKLIAENFPEILATLFRVAEREDSVNRGFQKHQSFTAASNAYEEIMSSGASQTPLEVSQQPSFKASYLMDEIDYLCGRVEQDPARLWTPALYIYVFRNLFSMIHPALGSLHTWSVIRRLRILISMAGEAAFHGYPLEMALHSLRRFVVEAHCAEDVIGICKYLLFHATIYLQDNPSFLTGFVVTTLVSLRAFIESPRDSTTQESDYVTTMSKAKEFHQWLVQLVIAYNSSKLGAFELEWLKKIVNVASQIRTAGTSKPGHPESELLSMILEDNRAENKLLDPSSRDIILSILCNQFEFSPNFRDDILGQDSEAAKSVPLLLDTISKCDNHPSYRLWVSRALGRAYAATGDDNSKTLHKIIETPIIPVKESSLTHLANLSRYSVLQYLVKTLYSENLGHTGAAENALHGIISNVKENDPLHDCVEEIPLSVRSAFVWLLYSPPNSKLKPNENKSVDTDLSNALQLENSISQADWLRNLCLVLINCCPNDDLLPHIGPFMESVEGVAEALFPQVLHMALLLGSGKYNVKSTVSEAFGQWFNDNRRVPKFILQQAIKSILYLRGQPSQQETTKNDRMRWLDIDFRIAADAANRCELYTTSLLFLEASLSEEIRNASRRVSTIKPTLPVDSLLAIYGNIDEKDSFYGIRQSYDLSAMAVQLEFENAGFKSLSFRSAEYDAELKHSSGADSMTEKQLIKALDRVEMNGIALSLMSTMAEQSQNFQEEMFISARKLEKWDITVPSISSNQPAVIFKAFQSIHDSTDYTSITKALNIGYSSVIGWISNDSTSVKSLKAAMSTFAVLSEVEDVISSQGVEQLLEAYNRLSQRESWMTLSEHDEMKTLDSCRETLFSTLSKSDELQSLLKVSKKDARIVQVRALLASSNLNRSHSALQRSLNSGTYLTKLIQSSIELGAQVDVAVKFEASNVLWDQGEMIASIRMLQDIEHLDFKNQDIPLGKPKVLATLGHRISEARSEKPEEVIDNYLKPAIKELRGATTGSEAGQVFHEFASFCDQQLQDPNSIEDYRRMQNLRDRKKAEVEDLNNMMKSGSSQAKEAEAVKHMRSKAKKWFDLDDREFQRLKEGRQSLLSQCLDNYLLCLGACDDYDNDALRFSALWLEHYDNEAANSAVKKHVDRVPSGKFASLMNQWTSRQLDNNEEFQKLLFNLILKICTEHPFHGMYHVFTSSKSKGAKDPAALSRNNAATKLVAELKSRKRTSTTWIAIHNSNVNYVRFAADKPQGEKFKEGQKVALAQTPIGRKLEQDARTNNIPPPIMKIPIRSDCNYDSVPRIQRYQPEFTLASGISMPKIVTVITNDGQKFKQLFKSGNDDLRQDAIMEQVFEQVNNLLKCHAETRQRNLGIRTYKVLPLTTTTGIIEFVTNTIPLNNYLIPAHQAHFPRDMKPSECRRVIADAQGKPNEERIRAFRKICEKFHPVMRFFFTDRFLDPDVWFEKRLMFTRSCAAISMLGYILGLGDRHGQNILLDEKTGEVVHIDLGIAFETGRVLPVPEVVPFRLTRDLEDGMGVTGAEGVFRRCCEFTLDALRKEEYSIMTILDVLRYDPLYSWSVSPLRMKKLQEDQGDVAENTTDEKLRDRAAGISKGPGERKDEEGEADRALTVVKKKLSKSLSVGATVNELIQQATDPRNLAVLFAGWAAYL
jgi:serine-protein kinase ATM